MPTSQCGTVDGVGLQPVGRPMCAAKDVYAMRVCVVTRPKPLLNFELAYISLMTLYLTIVYGVNVLIFNIYGASGGVYCLLEFQPR